MCVAKEAIFHINVQIERILIQKKMRVVITHLKKTRRRRVRARRSHTLFSPFENLFSASGGVYIERIFRESLSRDSERRMNLFHIEVECWADLLLYMVISVNRYAL